MTASDRRQFIRRFSTGGAVAALAAAASSPHARARSTAAPGTGALGVFNVRDYGATGDGVTKDTRAL